MKSGSITVNGVTDKEIIKILEIKTKFEGALTFSPNMLQPIPQQPAQPARQLPGQPVQHVQHVHAEQMYNNALLSFGTEKGVEAVLELLEHLTGKKSHHEH